MEYNEKFFKNIEASLNIENLFIENDNKELIIKYLNNEITEEFGTEYIKSKYK